jgi:hypothetical protein
LDLATTLLLAINETLTAGNAIIAVSLLLFNLTRNLNNRVAKTSSVVLACVTIAYVVDSFIALGPDDNAHQMSLRLQWIGIAFIPAAMLHLSDALLATTGLPSRGRRRRIVRILYLIASAFLVLVAFTDELIQFVYVNGNVSIQAGTVFVLYVIYFFGANGFAFYNVQRARKRCLTRGTERRMGYLQIAILTPAIGIFPYSVLLNPGDEFSIFGLILVNIANVIIILMLVFLSYPLYFFGSDKADRLVKKQLLDFLLRGPATGLIALAVINFTAQASRIFSLPGEAFTPIAVVAAVLLWQWFVSLSLPILEKFFIYRDEDDNQIAKLQTLNEKVLTRRDLIQLIKATTESICDYLRVDKAFVITFESDEPEFLQSIGTLNFSEDNILQNADLLQSLQSLDYSALHTNYVEWQGYALLPLFSSRLSTNNANQPMTIGLLGLLNPNGSLSEKLQTETSILQAYLDRVEQSLDDMQLQTEINNVLSGLLPQFQMTRSRAEDVEYRQSVTSTMVIDPLPDPEDVFEQVRAALRHYWGGSGITQSNLIKLHVVQTQIKNDDDTPINALRKLLDNTINSLRPDGERKMMSPEWTLYNILQLRFVEKKKVRDVARRLSMSEADLYRKQRVAIETVADLILKQEKEIHS